MSIDTDPLDPETLPEPIVEWQRGRGPLTSPTGGALLGAALVGALAMGALAIGAIAVGSMAIGRMRIGRLEVGRLVVKRAEGLTSGRVDR
jgi:hypothetical protein